MLETSGLEAIILHVILIEIAKQHPETGGAILKKLQEFRSQLDTQLNKVSADVGISLLDDAINNLKQIQAGEKVELKFGDLMRH